MNKINAFPDPLHNELNLSMIEQELIINTSKSGGPGGQHVNKTETRVSIGWNVANSQAITDIQKELLLKKLQATLTDEGLLVVINNTTRSQLQNKNRAFDQLIKQIKQALHKPKKRIKTTISKAVKEKRLQEKRQRSFTKRLRGGYEE